MALPLTRPVLPQLAKSAAKLPEGDGWVYEPKWDGFRTLAFVDGDQVELQSRNGKPLGSSPDPDARYDKSGTQVLSLEATRAPSPPTSRSPLLVLNPDVHPAAVPGSPIKPNKLLNYLSPAPRAPLRFFCFILFRLQEKIKIEQYKVK